MKKYKRVNPKITDLNPQDASKVFQYLRVLFEKEDLSLECFKNSINKFSLAQQYFILKFAKQYYNLVDSKSFISKRYIILENNIAPLKEEDVFNQNC